MGAPLALRQDASQHTRRDATWPRHLMVWGAFVLPILLLGAAQWRGTPSEIERLDAVLAVVPDFSDGYNQRGLALTRERRLDEGARDFETAIVQQPDHAKAQVNLLLLRARRTHRPADKIPIYHEALAIHLHDPRTHQLLADALWVTGANQAAMDHYRKALQIKPDHPRAHFGLAKLLAGRSAISEAILHYEAGLRTRPHDTRARTALALLHLEHGQLESAERHLEAALQDDPEDPRIRSALERVRARRSRR